MDTIVPGETEMMIVHPHPHVTIMTPIERDVLLHRINLTNNVDLDLDLLHLTIWLSMMAELHLPICENAVGMAAAIEEDTTVVEIEMLLMVKASAGRVIVAEVVEMREGLDPVTRMVFLSGGRLWGRNWRSGGGRGMIQMSLSGQSRLRGSMMKMSESDILGRLSSRKIRFLLMTFPLPQ